MRDRIQILEKNGLYTVRSIQYRLWIIPFYDYLSPSLDDRIYYSEYAPKWYSKEECEKVVEAVIKTRGLKEIVYKEILL